MSDGNFEYILQQLYLGLTASLATGASGVTQLFMTILDHTVTTKSWCADNPEDGEAQARRKTLMWMLKNLLQLCPCREDFAETGAWVKYPTALKWATEDFKVNGLDSWIIQYPPVGFAQLMRWYQILKLDIPDTEIEHIRTMKLVHFMTAKMLADLFKAPHGNRSWHEPYLTLLYRSFNAPGVPRNAGSNSLVENADFCHRFGHVANPERYADSARFLKCYVALHDDLVPRLQTMIFYLLYHVKSHATPKTIFTDLKMRYPLAASILDPTQPIPAEMVQSLLLTPFTPYRPADADLKLHNDSVTPFVTPFGPSVVHCGAPGCEKPFHPSGIDLTATDAAAIVREGRKRHLAEVFGLSSSSTNPFQQTTKTGLPDATGAPDPPSSAHYCLHISIARSWAHLDAKERAAVLGDRDGGKEAFVGKVAQYVCQVNRRGDIYCEDLERDIRDVLPSFFRALAVAVRQKKAGDDHGPAASDAEIAAYELKFEENTVGKKLERELLIGKEKEIRT